jgi:hypothetical protein
LNSIEQRNLEQRKLLSDQFYRQIDQLKEQFAAEKAKALREQKSLLIALQSQKHSQQQEALIQEVTLRV